MVLSAHSPLTKTTTTTTTTTTHCSLHVLAALELRAVGVWCVPSLYPLDFGVLVNATDTDPDQWTVEKVWYSGAIYDSLDDLAGKYANDPNTHKTQVRFAKKAETTQTVRGDRVPKSPQRAPVQVGTVCIKMITSPAVPLARPWALTEDNEIFQTQYYLFQA